MAVASTEVKVGIFVLVGIAILAYMTSRLGSFKLGEPEGYHVWAVFDHVTGLKKGAPVEMAGIQIGTVAAIGLSEDGRARVVMQISNAVKLPSDSEASVRTRGVLGDKYLAMAMGNRAAPKLKEGDRLARASVPTDLDEVMSHIGRIADDVKEITSSLKVSLASPESQANISQSLANIREITGALKQLVADNQSRLMRTLENMERFTSDLSQISGENKQALNETIRNFRKVSASLDTTITSLTSVAQKIDQGKGTIGALVNERQTLDDLNATLASLKQVAHKIEKGEGTLGKLVNDDTTITKIDEALTGINDYITQGDDWKVFVSYRGEYLFEEEGLRSQINLRLQPKADKFYLLGVVSDPVGQRDEKQTVTTRQGDGMTTMVTEKTVTHDKNSLLFNAQFGKRFRNLTARAGIFSSTGGVGLDYHLLDDQLTFTLEAYDFRSDANPHLKFAVDYRFWKHFFLTAGADDFASEEDHETFFVGAGVYFYDDDLKFLLTKAPMP